jgi:hypothetical protein
MTATQWTVLVAVVAVLAMAAIAIVMARVTRRRHSALRGRFGSEYDREVQQFGSVSRAERELLAREMRVRKQRLHALAEEDRLRFSADWHDLQARFVDDPWSAVHGADELIKAVMQAQGYDVESFDQRVADLSVDHAEVVRHYRAANELVSAGREGRTDTEQLRRAMVYYRALFADLLEPHVPLEGAHIEPQPSTTGRFPTWRH